MSLESIGFVQVVDPVALALPIAETGFSDQSMEGDNEDLQHLSALDHIVTDSSFPDNWLIEARLGFIVPFTGDEVRHIEFHKLDEVVFTGEFSGYSRLAIGRIIADDTFTVRALCATFWNGFFVNPELFPLADGELLHVPVMSVASIIPGFKSAA